MSSINRPKDIKNKLWGARDEFWQDEDDRCTWPWIMDENPKTSMKGQLLHWPEPGLMDINEKAVSIT